MKFTPQIKVALIIAATVLLVVGLAAAALYPQYNKAQAFTKQKSDLQSSLLSARTVLAYRTQLKNNHVAMQRQIANQKAEVPDDANLTAVIRQIQNMAYENNHWMTSIKNTNPVATEGVKYNSWDCEIILEGNWLDTLSFLRDMRDMKRQVRVSKVQFDRATDLRGGSTIANRVIKHWDPEAYPVRTTITATLYYIPEGNINKPAPTAADINGTAAAGTTTTQTGGAK